MLRTSSSVAGNGTGGEAGFGVCGGAGTGFGAVRGERYAAGDESGGPAPGFGSGGGGAECEERRRGWADKGMNGLPDGIDEGDFVG